MLWPFPIQPEDKEESLYLVPNLYFEFKYLIMGEQQQILSSSRELTLFLICVTAEPTQPLFSVNVCLDLPNMTSFI